MILVDTSVWVDLLGPKPRFVVPVEKMPLLAICPPIVQEIMQGVSHAKARTQIYQGLMSLSMYGNPMALALLGCCRYLLARAAKRSDDSVFHRLFDCGRRTSF